MARRYLWMGGDEGWAILPLLDAAGVDYRYHIGGAVELNEICLRLSFRFQMVGFGYPLEKKKYIHLKIKSKYHLIII